MEVSPDNGMREDQSERRQQPWLSDLCGEWKEQGGEQMLEKDKDKMRRVRIACCFLTLNGSPRC